MDQPLPRCLMLAGSSVTRTTGYMIHVWMALRAVRAAQGEDGPQPVLLSLESLRDWLRPSAFRSARRQAEKLGVRLVSLPIWPRKMPGNEWVNLFWSAMLVRAAVRRWGIGVVHAQSHFAAGVASRALRKHRGVELVFDVHGVDIEESLADGRLREGSAVHRLRMAMQREAVQRADWLLPVSWSLGEHLQAPFNRSRVVPCVSSLLLPKNDPEEIRHKARQRLDIGDRPVVLYLGGSSAWQRPEFIVECFKELRTIIRDAVWLIITGDPKTFHGLLQAAKIPTACYRILSLAHDQVATTAAAADVGLLLREDTIVNRVSSPTKFAEYLAVGIPVVLTDVLADFAAIARREDVGRVVPSAALAAEVAAEIASVLSLTAESRRALRTRCREAFVRHLSFDSVIPVYHEIYGREAACLPGPEGRGVSGIYATADMPADPAV